MKVSLNKVYTVEGTSYSSVIERLAINHAKTLARVNKWPFRVSVDGAPYSVVIPDCHYRYVKIHKGEAVINIDELGNVIPALEVTKIVEPLVPTKRVVNKYHHLLKYNTRDFKRLSF